MSEAPLFLDVNVPMYAAGRVHPYKEACAWTMTEIADGRMAAAIDTEIIQEILYRYGFMKEWHLAVEMATGMLDLIPIVLPVTQKEVQAAVKLFGPFAPQGVKARHVIHAAVMQTNGLTRIISTDRHFDQLPGIIRLDPQELFAHGNGR